MLARPRSPALAILAIGLYFPSPALADDVCRAAPDVSTCVNSDTLWPHAGPQRFVGVGGTETTDEGQFGFGLVSDYQSRPIRFRVPSPGTGSDQYAIDDQINGTFLWSYGVTRRLEADVAVPITFGQSGSGAEPITGSAQHLQDTAMRDMRFGVAYALVPRSREALDRVWSLTARFEMSAPTGDRTQFAGDRTAVYVPGLAADYRRGRWFAGLEIGARIRPVEPLLNARVGTQGLVAVGLGYDVLRRVDLLNVMVEARALPTFSSQIAGQSGAEGSDATSTFLAPAEWMVSVRSSPLGSGLFAVTAGGGGAIPLSRANLTEPRFRFVLGLRYEPSTQARDRDRDRIPDARDKCPDDAGPPPSGCPEGMRPPLRLDLRAATDRCPDEPDPVDGFKADDGCPDEDADKDGIDDRYDRCPLVPDATGGLSDGCPSETSPARPEKP